MGWAPCWWYSRSNSRPSHAHARSCALSFWLAVNRMLEHCSGYDSQRKQCTLCLAHPSASLLLDRSQDRCGTLWHVNLSTSLSAGSATMSHAERRRLSANSLPCSLSAALLQLLCFRRRAIGIGALAAEPTRWASGWRDVRDRARVGTLYQLRRTLLRL